MKSFPADWPEDGPIDLALHDRPHASSTTEWWYQNGHSSRAVNATRFSRPSSARSRATTRRHKAPLYAHSLTWALFDPKEKVAHTMSRVDPARPKKASSASAAAWAAKTTSSTAPSPRCSRRGRCRRRTACSKAACMSRSIGLNLQYGPDVFRRLEDGRYALKLHDKTQERRPRPRVHAAQAGDAPGRRRRRARQQRRVDVLLLHPAQRRDRHDHAPRRHARDHPGPGLVRPRVRRRRARRRSTTRPRPSSTPRRASASTPSAAPSTRSARWRGTGSRSSSTTAARCRCTTSSYVNIPKTAGQWVILIDPQGNRTLHTDLELDRRRIWRSTQTFFDYPVLWRVRVPSAGIDLQVEAAFDDQEFITLISKPSFWEGRVHAKGKVARPGAHRRRRARAQRLRARTKTSTSFFEEVGKVVRESVERVLPMNPTYDAGAQADRDRDEREHYMRRRRRRAVRAHAHQADPRDRRSRRQGLALVRGAHVHRHRRRRLAQVRRVARAARADARRLADRRRRRGQVGHAPRRHDRACDARRGQAINSGTAAYFIGSHLLDSRPDLGRAEDAHLRALLRGDARRSRRPGDRHRRLRALMPEVVESGDVARCSRSACSRCTGSRPPRPPAASRAWARSRAAAATRRSRALGALLRGRSASRSRSSTTCSTCAASRAT